MMKHPRPRSTEEGPILPPMITYGAVPGRESLWTATIDTGSGLVSATRHSLHETREALEVAAREALRRGRSGDDR